MKKTLWLKLLRYLQSKCQHPDYAVKADILEGDWRRAGNGVQWCEICGAFRFTRFVSTGVGMGQISKGEWREPRPDWHTPKEREEYLKALRESK